MDYSTNQAANAKEGLPHDSHRHWDLYKSERNKVNIEMCKAKSNYLISDDKSIAETCDDYFINVGMNIAAESEELYGILSDYQVPSAVINRCTDLRFTFADIDVNNVAISLSNLKTSKATGMDNIPAKILKMTSYIIAPSLNSIFNLSLKSGVYIDEWKLAKVIPIYKSDNRRKCKNYRPMSILPTVSKVFGREDQVYRYLNENSLLSKFQSGFDQNLELWQHLLKYATSG